MNLTPQTKLEILCAYLPHGVKIEGNEGTIIEFTKINHSVPLLTCISDDYRPILRHPDDMIDEELCQLGRILWGDATHRKEFAINDAKSWLRGTMKPVMSQKTAQIATMYLYSRLIDTFGAIEAGWAVRKETN